MQRMALSMLPSCFRWFSKCKFQLCEICAAKGTARKDESNLSWGQHLCIRWASNGPPDVHRCDYLRPARFWWFNKMCIPESLSQSSYLRYVDGLAYVLEVGCRKSHRWREVWKDKGHCAGEREKNQRHNEKSKDLWQDWTYMLCPIKERRSITVHICCKCIALPVLSSSGSYNVATELELAHS